MEDQTENGSGADREHPPAFRLHTAQAELRSAVGPPRIRSMHLDQALHRLFASKSRRVVAIIPAHNEQAGVAVSLESLSGQTRPADVVIVIVDNCTDQTRALAWAAGATVVESVDNPDRKAGALNLALGEVLPLLSKDDAVLMMDADTTLSPRFVELALRVLSREAKRHPVGGVGGIFIGSRANWSLVRQLQQNEAVSPMECVVET